MTIIDIGTPQILLSDGDIEEIIKKHFKEQGIIINDLKFHLKEITAGYGLGEHQKIIFDGALAKYVFEVDEFELKRYSGFKTRLSGYQRKFHVSEDEVVTSENRDFINIYLRIKDDLMSNYEFSDEDIEKFERILKKNK